MMKKLIVIIGCIILAACSSPTKKEATNDKVKPAVEENTKVSFVGVGDNLIHNVIYEQADRSAGSVDDGQYDFTAMYTPVKQDIEQADLAFINQETILGGDELGLSGYPTFNSPIQIANDLQKTGFNIVNTATNHSLDKFQKGVDNSSRAWAAQKDMIVAGSYTSNEDRNTIRVIERKGIKFSFLAYTYGTNGITSPNDYTIAYFEDDQITRDVEKAKEVSDVVIVSAHWGDENTNAPNEFQKKYAKLFADLKVDVVVGTHPHVIQPVEWLHGRDGNKTLVINSLGNFMSGMLDVNNTLSGMIKFDFVQNKESKAIAIENVMWEPLVTHYSGDAKNIMTTRKDFAVYKLRDYTDQLATQHGLNGYEGQQVTKSDLYKKTEAVIKDIPIVK